MPIIFCYVCNEVLFQGGIAALKIDPLKLMICNISYTRILCNKGVIS